MKIPLANQLRKRHQVEIAELQDEVVSLIYDVSEDVVFHGETAIWRCFSGKRFSEDLDFYSKTFPRVTGKFSTIVESHGLTMKKLKDTGNIIFSSISNGRATVKVEINHVRDVNGQETPYELVDGTFIEVLSISPEEFMLEKIEAYRDRLFVRDLYDIFHLLSLDIDVEVVSKDLSDFISNIEKTVDESLLRSIVYVGIAPSFKEMVNSIRRKVS